MAVNKQLAKRIRRQCAASSRGDFNQASTGTGKMSSRKVSARAKGGGTHWGYGLERPRA